ncbi:hypothetical protein MOKP64_49560 [Mycobacterium avium subsp. hominissuis]
MRIMPSLELAPSALAGQPPRAVPWPFSAITRATSKIVICLQHRPALACRPTPLARENQSTDGDRIPSAGNHNDFQERMPTAWGVSMHRQGLPTSTPKLCNWP